MQSQNQYEGTETRVQTWGWVLGRVQPSVCCHYSKPHSYGSYNWCHQGQLKGPFAQHMLTGLSWTKLGANLINTDALDFEGRELLVCE